MHTEYEPTPAQLLQVLHLLGHNPIFDPSVRPDGPTDDDKPLLVGKLLAMAEVTNANLVNFADEHKVHQAYHDVFLDPELQEIAGDPLDGWDNFITTLSECGRRLHSLHHTEPPRQIDPLDYPLADVAATAGLLAQRLSNARFGLSLIYQGIDGDPVEPELLKIAPIAARLAADLAEICASDDFLAVVAASNPKTEEAYEDDGDPYVQRVTVDLGDDYAQVMAGYLDRMVEGGHIDDWEHQPHNGGVGNGSIALIGGGKYANLVMNFEDALEYARGYMTAVEDLAKKDKNH